MDLTMRWEYGDSQQTNLIGVHAFLSYELVDTWLLEGIVLNPRHLL